MTHSPTRRFLIAIGEILLITATSLSMALWPTQPARATIASPGSLSTTSAPAGIIINSPWVVDATGTEWAYGTTSASMGTLISRNQITGVFTSRAITAGDEGSIAGLYSPLANVAVFSARRTGLGNRLTAFDLATGTRISTRTMATDETLIRALAFNSAADSYIVGTNQNPAKVMKFGITNGNLEYSSTLATGLKEITAFIPNGTELLAAVNTNPIKLVSVTRNRLVIGSVVSLPAGTPTLMDPIVVGTTAYLGTDATPGRITAIDIPTQTVIASAILNTGEIGARNLVVDNSTGTLYATTDSTSGPRIASFRLTDLRRLGTTQLSAGTSATSLLLSGGMLAAGFAGTRGVETLTVAPEPNAPVITGIQAADSSLVITWNSGGSVEPVLEYTASASAGSSSASCSTNGTSCTIQGLNNGTTYSISVVARSAAGISPATLATGMPRTVPDAPTTPRVTRGNTEVTVTWTPRGDGGVPITGYRATASPSGKICESITQTCTIFGLPNGVPQTVQVVARNLIGTSQPSAPSASVTPATIPSTPQIEFAGRSNHGGVVVWKPPTDNGGDDVVSYLVRVTQGSTTVSESTTSDTSITLDGLANGVIYKIVVSATNTVGTGGPSENAYVTPATVPDAPGAITAVRQDKGADISWIAPLNNGGDPITGYRIQVQNGNEPPKLFIATESPYRIRGLENGTTYSVSVSAINSVGDSVASENAYVTPATVPDAPSAINAVRQDKGADISWIAPLNNGGDHITGYRVQVRAHNGQATSFITTESPYSIRGLENGTTYSVSVSAINSVGDSVPSETSNVIPATNPDAPRAITVRSLDSAADVSWTAPTNDGGDPITGYRVRIWREYAALVEFETSSESIVISGLNNGTEYRVVVTSVNTVGESVASESALVTPATVPDPPLDITALRQDQGADVSWTAPSNDGGDTITCYRIQVQTGDEPPKRFIATESPHSIRGLHNGTTYSVTVSAINSIGDSVESESALVTPATVPDPPTSLNATAVDGAVNLEWSASSNDGGDPITGYRIRIWRENAAITEFDTPITNASVPGLTNGVDYRVTVTSVNTVGESVASESAFVMPISPPVVTPPAIDPPVIDPPVIDPPVIDPPVIDPPVVDPPVVDPPVVEPPVVVGPPVVDPPVVDPPIINPPVAGPPASDPPPTVRPPSPPVDVAVISATRKSITLGWRVGDSGGAPVIDFIVHKSRYKNRGFTVWPDSISAAPRLELQKPGRGGLYVRVIAVTAQGESAPSQVTLVARAKKLANTKYGGRALE